MIKQLLILVASIIILSGCNSNEEVIDTEYPVIDITFSDSFPTQCSSIRRGEAFTFKAKFRDNMQLGSFSIDIHHNFDHHTHSTEVNDCGLDVIKTPVKPFFFIKNYSIPDGLREYVAELTMEVPADIDAGDYHFTIMLTDEEGWQSIKGLSIKIN